MIIYKKLVAIIELRRYNDHKQKFTYFGSIFTQNWSEYDG